jgi:hypothetical protein
LRRLLKSKTGSQQAMLSFWTFMPLLMGAAAAITGGIAGVKQRDDFASVRSTCCCTSARSGMCHV